MPTMMSTLDNPWKPLSKETTTPSWMTVPPLVFLSTPGTPISRPRTQTIKKMEQAMASSSSFIENLKGKDQQQTALNKAINNFWNTSDVPPEPAPTNIASYLSIGVRMKKEKKN